MLGTIVKRFQWPLVRKGLSKCSPFTIYHKIILFKSQVFHIVPATCQHYFDTFIHSVMMFVIKEQVGVRMLATGSLQGRLRTSEQKTFQL